MFCQKCGTKLSDEAIFCPNCGCKNEVKKGEDFVKTTVYNEQMSEIKNSGRLDSNDNRPLDNFSRYFDLKGRRNRKTYAIFFAMEILLGIACAGLPLLGFILAWVDLTNDVKRLHDIGHSGYVVIGFYVALIALIAILGPAGLIALAFPLYLFVKEGDPQDNEYGPAN